MCILYVRRKILVSNRPLKYVVPDKEINNATGKITSYVR